MEANVHEAVGDPSLPARSRLGDAVATGFTTLVYLQRRPVVGKLASAFLRARGTHVPPETVAGEGIRLLHTGHGVVIDRRARIGPDVTLFHNVTVGRAQPWAKREEETGYVTVERGAILCAGAVVLVPRHGHLRVAEGSVVGANAVLTESTNPWEIWAGSPARMVGVRPRAA